MKLTIFKKEPLFKFREWLINKIGFYLSKGVSFTEILCCKIDGQWTFPAEKSSFPAGKSPFPAGKNQFPAGEMSFPAGEMPFLNGN